MKKRMKIALPILLLSVMLITALSLFLFSATAADASEATLKVVTINYGADSSKESYGYEVSTTAVSTETGSFASLAAKLENLAPEKDTRYILTLNKDVTVDAPFVISGNEHTEIWLDLGGHTLTYTADGPMMYAAGSGATIRVWGEFNADGSYGKFISTAGNGSFVKIGAGSTDYVDIKYVDCTFTSAAENAAFFFAEGGTLTVEHSIVNHTSGNPVRMFNTMNANLNLKYSEFWGDKATTLVQSSASNVYIEGGEMLGACIVVSDETASNIVLSGFVCEVDTGFVQGSAETKTYILGSEMEIYSAIASGEANADNLIFYYGNGSMYVIGHDPSEYGLGNTDCSYVLAGDTWTMVCSSTSKVMGTAVKMGLAPESKYFATPDEAGEATLGGVGLDTRNATNTTLRIVTLLADYSSGKSGCTNVTYKGGENGSVIFDLNGHNLTYASSDVAGNNFFSVSFDMHFTLDGADVSGKVGTLSTACRYAKIIYARQSSNSGQINYHLVTRVSNINTVATALYNESASGSPVFWITAGYCFMNNVSITYTGETTATMAATSLPMLTFGHTPFPKGVAFVNGLTITSTSTLSVPVYGMNAKESWRVFANNYKTEGLNIGATADGSGSKIRLENSNISSKNAVFSGSGKISVYDSTLTTATGLLVSGTAIPTFYYGTGKNVVYTNGNVINGNASAEDGYGFGPVAEGVYKVVSESDGASITLPAVFSDGMMLQRNKQVNIYGYCEEIGGTVRVTIGDAVAEAVVDENGKWVASFAPLSAAKGVTVEIDQVGKGVEGIADKIIKDVNIGEIWVMTGQSNASLFSGHLEDVNEVALLSETLGIREFSLGGYTLLPQQYGAGAWHKVTSSIVKKTSSGAMSALGYTVAAKLAAELGPDIPVGIVTMAQGSTKIITWMDYEQLSKLNPDAAAAYDDWVAQGTLPSSAHGTNAVGTVIYNKLVYPLEGFTTAGVMWYQGCGDITSQWMGSTPYTEYFKSLEYIFRRAFGNGQTDLPIYVMQLAPYTRSDTADGTKLNNLMDFKYEQYQFCQDLENTYLVSLGVDGMAFTSQDYEASAFIHPARKSPVGNRTADMILANEYGIKYRDVVSYPQPISAVRNADGSVTITFDTELTLLYGDTVEGFQLFNGSSWKDAVGAIDGNKLTLTGVDGATGVRYGYGRVQVELKDGTIAEINGSNWSCSSSACTFTDALTGTKYTIELDSGDVLRTMTQGNITNASGIPLVLFKMDVAAE